MYRDNRQGLERFFPRLYASLRSQTRLLYFPAKPRSARTQDGWETMKNTDYWRWPKAKAWFKRQGKK
jgi:hypothetical protein